MATLVERKRIDLLAKSTALEHEFTHWKSWTAEGGRFEKHHSQVERITARMTGAIAGIRRDLEDGGSTLLAQRVRIEQRILTIHAVWQFFRSRLALRGDDYLRPYLQACDEFAWACYEPLRDRYVAAAKSHGDADAERRVKEPPLVYLNGGWSPFAVPRASAFGIDRAAFNVDGPLAGWLAGGDLQALVDELPFPMIGVPWFEISHLPEALVIGHEAGHVAESDFKLTRAIEDAFARANISADHRGHWQRWRAEVFADIFGCLSGGPAFVLTLVDFLAGDPSRVELKTPVPDGAYPMPWLRIRLALETLKATGFGEGASAAEEAFTESYKWPDTCDPFTAEAASVVEQVLNGPYETLGGAKLRDVLPFPRDAAGDPGDVDLAVNIAIHGPLWKKDPRALFGAAKRLYDTNPAVFNAKNWSAHICALVVEGIPPGTRGSEGQDLADRAAADLAEGASWLT